MTRKFVRGLGDDLNGEFLSYDFSARNAGSVSTIGCVEFPDHAERVRGVGGL
ncbi:hypothetical protein ABIB14_000191 [Arthrobacter sp. UYEF3]